MPDGSSIKTDGNADGSSFSRVFFGGPDCLPRNLRDLLDAHIRDVPPGGEIRWITYYFRDEELAAGLVRAHRRGVDVWVAVEKTPRTAHANQRVAGILAGLGGGFRQIRHRFFDNFSFRRPRLHEKLYFFSHPRPHVLLGSFNPSTNRPEDPGIISEIGDQDLAYNFLVELSDDYIVSALKSHMRHVHCGVHGPWERLFPPDNPVIRSGDTRIYIFPRRRRGVLKKYLTAVPPGSVLRVAVSHMNDPQMADLFCRLNDKGVLVEIIAHDTFRRVPLWVEKKLSNAKINFRRYRHPQGISMHNKFILIENNNLRQVIFGSMNLSKRSLHANHELLVFSGNPGLFHAFCRKWKDMAIKINEFYGREFFLGAGPNE